MSHNAPLPYRISTVWVVVADHDHARTYARQARDTVLGHGHNAEEIHAWDLTALPEYDLDGGRDSDLALEIADRLNHARSANRFDGVVIIAPPALLGHMRPHLTKNASDAVVLELAKDLTMLSPAKLVERINDLLPARDGVTL